MARPASARGAALTSGSARHLSLGAFAAVAVVIQLGAILASAAGPAAAQDFRRGLSAYNGGDYVGAVDQWRLLAENGDADAQAALGFMLQSYKWCDLAYSDGAAEAALACRDVAGPAGAAAFAFGWQLATLWPD